MLAFSDHPLNPSKPFVSIHLGAFWVKQGLFDMLKTILSNSDFGKRSIAREITTFASHVNTQSVNSY